MKKIVSRRQPPPPPPEKKDDPTYQPRIIIRPDGSWAFPDQNGEAIGIPPGQGDKAWPFPTGGPATPPNSIDANDEEVLRRTAGGIDVNYIQTEDC